MPRVAAWVGARRWWFLALGALATTLALPRRAGAQGLRSAVAAVSLSVTAPPHLRSSAGVVSRGPSVTDVTITLPSPGFEVASAEVMLDGTSSPDAVLYARGANGTLTPLEATWVPIRDASAATFRAVAPSGGQLGAAEWRARVRFMPRDTARRAVMRSATIAIPGAR